MSRLNRGRKAAYHHGDLRRQLIGAASAMVRADGIESLTLRKLAERVGVSQTALYHHFGDKQDLLCAMGEEGIHLFEAGIAGCFDESASPERRLEAFVQGYVRFALGNPELYELMFGRTTWRGTTTASFQAATRGAFRSYVQMIDGLQKAGRLSAELNPLRLAQVIWGTLHGLCCMHNDGLLFTPGDVQEIGEYALWLLRRAAPRT